MPSYQTSAHGIGVVNAGSSGKPCGAAAGTYCREVPDVSALAGPFPYLNYVSGSWGSWGGTSLAAPLWASLIALSDASNTCSGENIGFANPLLYDVAATDPAAFNDVTVGNNDLTGKNGGVYRALVGYDMATGLGTPNASVLPDALCAGATPNTVTVTNPGSQSTHLSAAVSLQIKATDVTSGQMLSYRAFGLPPGLSINGSNGLISGKPTSWGTSTVVVSAHDGAGASESAAFSWSVTLAITSANSVSDKIGKYFVFYVTTTGVPTSIKVTTNPPKGVKFQDLGNGKATLSGTPKNNDAVGKYPLVFQATFGKGKTAAVVSQSFMLTLT